MKNFRKVLLAVVFAVILALGAVSLTACKDNNDGKDNTKPRYTLTFMVGTVVYDKVPAEEGSTYTLNKPDPTRQNFVFEGWSQTPNGEVEALPDKMPSGDRTYYAIFSARFNLNFNAGIGSIPDDKKTIIVKEGDDLYDLVKDVTPTVSDSDATFKGWFLRGTAEITSTSGQKMPKGNVEVVAKYSVGYKINIYLEEGFDSGVYGEEPDEVVNKTAYVGDKVAGLPSYAGYYYDDGKDNDVLYVNLNKNSAQNAFELYYKLLGYDTVFNANLPAEVEYTGTMGTMTCGHGEEYTAPVCDFEADGYRFYGWSTTPDGDVAYRAGEKFSVERSTTLYAQWVKGMTELAGLSADRVYLISQKEGGMIPYLERTGLEDIEGEYNQTTHIFTFKNEDATDPDEVLLRGVADSAHNMFTYLNTVSSTVYKLQKIDGTEDASVTLKLNDDGTAVYTNGAEDAVTGAYVGTNDGSMLFTVGGEAEFAFRLVHSPSSFVNFMIRGDEYGTWNNITQAGVVDLSYTLALDGYGYATMFVSGLNSSLSGRTTSAFDGRYVYTSGEDAYQGDEGTEVMVRIYNSSLQMRMFACLLIKGTYHTTSATDNTVYTNVYLQRFLTTLYGAPATGDELDTATADKIELSGYSVVEDSAVYTYTNDDGEPVTVKGKYSYDSSAGTLRITRAGGNDLLFEVSMYGEGDNAVPVFEPVQELFGQYAILGLDSVYGPNALYTLQIYNNNRAAFAFMMPVYDDAFYGNVVYEYTRMFVGEYTVAEEGKTSTGGDDPRANVYEYSATISPAIANYLYNVYGSIFQYPLYVSSFGSFRFQFVYSAVTQRISYINVTVTGDFQGGRKLTYNDVEYTLDGFGTAVGTAADGTELKMPYNYDTSIGIARLFVTPDAGKPEETVLFINPKGDGNYVQYESNYVANNAGTAINMIFFKDDSALIALNSSSGAISFYSFSYGHVTWDGEEHVYGRYVRDNSIEFGDIYVGLNKEYNDFKFALITTTEKDKDGKDVQVTRLYVYEVNEDELNEDGEFVIENAGGDKLTINRNDATVVYLKKGNGETEDATYEGKYIYFDGTVQLRQTVGNYYVTMSFKLDYVDGEIESFHAVGSETGYYLDGEDAKSYLYLTGEKAGEDGVFAGDYYVYSAETEDFTKYEGTYTVTAEQGASGYDFTYATGEKDEDGKAVTETFTFATTTDATGIPYFQKYLIPFNNVYVLHMNASYGEPVAVGILSGGGYNAHVLTLFPNSVNQQQYQGVFDWDTELEVWAFTATNGSLFYFKILSGVGVFILDNAYAAEVKGIFELSETIDIEVPATEGQDATEDAEAVPAVPAHTAHVTKIEMSGMAFAYLHYDYNGEDKILTGIYVQYATNGFAFLLLDSEDSTALFRFRLMTSTDEESGEVSYVAELADMDYYGTFVGEDLTVINVNGFEYAYYVDSYGRVYSGYFRVIESDEDSALIEIEYIDTTEYTIKYAYARLDFENRTFVAAEAPEEETQP